MGPWPSEKQLLLPTSQLTLGDLELAHDHPGPPPGHSSPIPCPFLSILALSLFQTHLSPIPDTGEYLVTYAEECGTTQDGAFLSEKKKKKLLVAFYFMKVPLEVGMSGTSRRNLAVASRTKEGQQA